MVHFSLVPTIHYPSRPNSNPKRGKRDISLNRGGIATTTRNSIHQSPCINPPRESIYPWHESNTTKHPWRSKPNDATSRYGHDSKPSTEIPSTVWLRPEASVHATWHSVDTSGRNHGATRHKSCTIAGSRNRQSSGHRCQDGSFRQSYNPVSTIPPFHPR